MKTHEQINYACSKGLYPIVQKEDGRVCIFSPHKDGCDYRFSHWYSTQEKAENWIGDDSGYTQKQMEIQSQKENWKIIGYYDTPYEKYEVGEKVVVKKTGELGKVDSFLGEGFSNKYQVFMGTYRGHDCKQLYNHSDLLPYFDTTPSEKEIEKAKKTLEDAGLLVDGKVLKK